MNIKVLHKNILSKLTLISLMFWILSILVFGLTLFFATGMFRGTVLTTRFGNSSQFMYLFLGSIIVGIFAFIMAFVFYFMNFTLVNGWINYKKSVLGTISFLVKFCLIFLILPFYLIWRFFKNSTISLWKKFTKILLIVVFILPFWLFGYEMTREVIAYQLGYLSEDLTIVGTGSMYPTWPKGSKGKDPKELAKEIVGKAGFFKYPNGMIFFGDRIFEHEIERGDIVTAENEEIIESSKEIYGEPGGVLKRVVGIGGDKIELRDGIVYINDQAQKEQYTAKPRSTFGEEYLQECKAITIPQDSVFLMGDNRKGSGDSREFGPVKYDDIDYVLPYKKQKDELSKNWRDTSNDLEDSAKPTIDRVRFVELLNQKRKDNKVSEVKYEPELEKSAILRGNYILKENDFEQNGAYTMEKSMSDAGYWNTYWWEWTVPGYYEAEELIEDYLERDSTDAKNAWFDKNFDDIGIAEVHGTLNGCPTQVIVIHVAGYIPATYEPNIVQSWRDAVNNLNSIIPPSPPPSSTFSLIFHLR